MTFHGSSRSSSATPDAVDEAVAGREHAVVDEQPALGRLDRDGAAADLGRLPRVRRPGPARAGACPSSAGRGSRCRRCRRTACARCRDGRESIAKRPSILRGKSTPLRLKGRKAFSSWWNVSKSCRPADADRRAVVAVAPGDVVAVLDPDDARVVAVDERADLGVVALEPDPLRIELPGQAVPAEPAVELHPPRPVVAAEHAGEAALERDDGAVEDAVRGRQQVARDHRVPRVAPDRAGAARPGGPPRQIRAARPADDLDRRDPDAHAASPDEVVGLDLDQRRVERVVSSAAAARS